MPPRSNTLAERCATSASQMGRWREAMAGFNAEAATEPTRFFIPDLAANHRFDNPFFCKTCGRMRADRAALADMLTHTIWSALAAPAPAKA